jgi:hypothetical protein
MLGIRVLEEFNVFQRDSAEDSLEFSRESQAIESPP